jgi:hypothetical protein
VIVTTTGVDDLQDPGVDALGGIAGQRAFRHDDADPDQADQDADRVGDACDPYPALALVVVPEVPPTASARAEHGPRRVRPEAA